LDHNDATPKLRIPVPVEDVQVNFCKNPACLNFGVPASQEKQPRGQYSKDKERDTYTIVSGNKAKTIVLKCNLCGEHPTIKSNQAIFEEVERLSKYLLDAPAVVSCPNPNCPNHVVPISTPKSYAFFGKTRAGSQRYRCSLCHKVFSVGKPTVRQKKPHKNATVFKLLMNKVPFARICEVAGLGSMNALYWKIDFLHKQCLAFAASKERKLLEGFRIKRLYIGTDRQDYMVNWSNSADKRNIMLHAVGSADNATGYVFGLHLNFDPDIDARGAALDAVESGDLEMKIPFRKHARVWLPEDYSESAKASLKRRGIETYGTLQEGISSTYSEAQEREDIEVFEEKDYDLRLPADGMQVHAEYTLYGHFFFLRNLFGGVEKVRFFLDQDAGMRASCLSAFVDEIKEKRCDAFYVCINKNLTIGEKRQVMAAVRKEWEETRKEHPDLSDSKLRLLIIKERIRQATNLGKWSDKWIIHPFPSMSEPEKAVCYLTNVQGYDEDHLSWLYNKASLHAIDRFFMQIRRRLSLLERPIATPSSSGRKWYGYSAYNPAIIIKMLDIFRVFYNYIEVGKDRQTPAMRLGLAKGVIDIQEIIHYASI
jgi:transposase-like protein